MRTIERKDELGEVFTPPELVNEILDHFPPEVWTTYDFWLDPTCGDGNFLVEVKRRLLENFDLEDTLSMIYGADIMEDNCRETICRLCDIDDSDIQTIEVKELQEKYFDFYDVTENEGFRTPTQEKDAERLRQVKYDIQNYLPNNDVLPYLRPGLIALFYNKKNKKLIPTIVQADGLVYDYSFGCKELSNTELKEIRDDNKPFSLAKDDFLRKQQQKFDRKINKAVDAGSRVYIHVKTGEIKKLPKHTVSHDTILNNGWVGKTKRDIVTSLNRGWYPITSGGKGVVEGSNPGSINRTVDDLEDV